MHKKSLNLIAIAFAATLIASMGLSAQPLPFQVSFERLSIPGTIRSSQVVDIIQDDRGLMWIAGDGLYRYDGFKFKQYKDVEGSADKLGAHDIHEIHFEAARNRILVATHRFGLLALYAGEEQLVPLPSPLGLHPIINYLEADKNGKVWAVSHNSGLFRLDGDTLRRIEAVESRPHPSSLYVKDSHQYVGIAGKVLILRDGHPLETIALSGDEALAGTPLATALTIDRQGSLWVGTEKHGVFRMDLSTKKPTLHLKPTEAPFFSRIVRIYEDRHGLIWILTKANGVVMYSPRTGEKLHLTRSPFSTKSLSSDNAFCITEDRDGILWIGTTGDINKFDRRQIKFRHIYHNSADPVSLTDNMVRCISPIRQELWIGTDGGYINAFDPAKEKIRKIKVEVPGTGVNHVPHAFLTLDDDRILVGTSLGLLEYSVKHQTFRFFEPLREKLKGRPVRQIIRRDNLLLLISNGRAVLHDLRSGETEMLPHGGHPASTNVTFVHVDDRNQVWLGSNKGVSHYDPATRSFRFVEFTGIPAMANGANMLVLSMAQIRDKLYVGTFNSGLWKVDIRDIHNIPPPKRYDQRPGLLSRTIYSVLPGSDGHLWLSSNNGLVRFDTASQTFTTFTVSEGVQEEEFNRLAYASTRDGYLAFGGVNGLNYFDPRTIVVQEEEYVPQLLAVSAGNPLLSRSGDVTITAFKNPVEVSYEQNFLGLSFFVPRYNQPRRYSVFYRLRNFEKEWNEAVNENTAVYPNLPPGAYAFEVKTMTLNGREQLQAFPIVIAAPYWKTWWFVLVAIVVVAFLMNAIIRGYLKRSRRDRIRLENLLRERTSEIEKSREELQILNQKKDLIFSILSHDLRSPLTTLKGFLGYLIDHADELSTEELKRHAINIRNSVTNSLDLIDNTLFWSLSQMGTIQYTPTRFSLHQLLEKLRGLYQLTAEKKRIPLSIECDELITVHGDENMIYVTLRNLVSNALKFTTEGNPVRISCTAASNTVEIKVEDRGIGMSKEYVSRILSRDQPMLKKGTSNEKGTGLGLLLCKSFIEQNKGELRIHSVEHVGTTFIVVLPAAPVEEIANNVPA